MTDPGVHDLHHGHFGQPTYDVENKTWIFARVPGHRRLFQPAGDRHITIDASTSNASTGFLTSRATELDRQQSHLLALNPELRTAAPFLAREAQLSGTVTAVACNFEPLRSDLLAFGRATDVGNKGGKGIIRIAALPGGAVGESLRLVQLQYERHGWSKDKSIWLKVPTLNHGEVGWWPGNGTPIQQICCACQPEDRSTFVAVRTPRSVDILHPLFHKIPVPPPKGLHSPSSFPASRLEACPLASLTSRPDQPAFADVTFNPWYQRQFATLDQIGNWSVHDIEGRRGKRWDYHTVLSKQGCLEVPITKSDVKEGTLPGHHDGWGRVLWANEVSTIAVCNRRILQFVDFQTGSSIHYTPSSLRLAFTSSWILDLRRDPQNSSRILVLTSTHLLVLKAPVFAHEFTGEKKEEADVLIAWRHSMNDDDTTLQIFPFVDGEETIVFLRSLQDPLVLLFRYRQHSDIEILVSSSDPSAILSMLHENASKLSGMYMEALDFGEDPHATISGPGNEYRDQGIRFYNFHLFSNKLEASQRLMFISDNAFTDAERREAASRVESPAWTKKVTTQSSTLVMDSFIVPDDFDDLEYEPEKAQWPKRTTARRLRTGNQMLDMTLACRELEKQDKKAAKEDSSVIMAELAEDFSSTMVPEDYRNDTLLHLGNRGSYFDVADVDETDWAFLRLTRATFTQDGEAASLVAKPVARIPRLTPWVVQYEDDVPSISLTYDTIVRSWISTLPAHCPGRVRLADERLARHIATAVCLASTTLRIQQPEAQAELEEFEGTESQFMTPSRSTGKGKGIARRESLPSYSQISGYSLPTPEPTPSLSSATTMSSGMSSLTSSAWTRLSQLTKIGTRVPTPGRFERQFLDDWRVGDDPKQFKWSSGRKRKAAWEQEDLSEKQRAKLFKQAEKKLKKQRRETELFLAQSQSQTPRLMVSQPIPDPRSSPGPRRRTTIGGSSQMMNSSQLFPATQVERGAHGGRSKKKRRRTEGF